MKLLEINDLCICNEIKTDIVYLSILSMFDNNFDTENMNFQSKVTNHTLTLFNKYINDDLVIKDSIQKLIDNEKNYFEDRKILNELHIYDETDFHDITKQRLFYSKLVSNGSSITQTSRIGPGNKIILPANFKNIKFKNTYFNFYYTNHLTDKIIVFRNDDSEYSNFKYIKNKDKYVLFFDDEYKKQYNIINIYSEKSERIKKLNKLINL